MPPRKPVPPPVKCSATSKQTGKSCGQWGKPGTVPPLCRWHGADGGAPDQRERIEANLVLTRLMAADHRPVWEVISDAVHTVDALHRHAKTAMADGTLTLDDIGKLADSAKLAHTLGAASVTTMATAVRADAAKLQTEQLVGVVKALLAGLGGRGLLGDATEAQVVVSEILSSYHERDDHELDTA